MFSVERQEPGLKGWHEGELKLQKLTGHAHEVRHDHEIVRSYLPESQRIFHTSNISFLPLTTQDPIDERLWVSILVGADAFPGFISSPDDHTLIIEAEAWIGDPIRTTLPDESSGNLVAGVGVELWSRRRNKVAGKTSKVEWNGSSLTLEMKVNQTTGNCPKYISIRRLQAAPFSRRPTLSLLSRRTMSSSDVLPPSIINFVQSCDTAFLGTVFTPSPSTDSQQYPPHLGCNHRGGRPGFIRVDSSKRGIVLPDLSGNRFLSSLGNIETNQHIGITLVNWQNGSILYLTGLGTNVHGGEAKKIMNRTSLLTFIEITGFIFVEDALPFREVPGTLEPSPYSPPIRYLNSEVEQPTAQENVLAKVINIKLHSIDLATFEFETSKPISYKAGQYAIFDMKPLVGDIDYVHMSDGDEKSPNEDGIRTWTISSASPLNEPAFKFSITVRRIYRGRITTLLFTYAKQFLSSSTSTPSLELPLLGIGGTFILPEATITTTATSSFTTSILYIAGGIGITPFLSFLRSILLSPTTSISNTYSIRLLLSTKEPTLMINLIKLAMESTEEIIIKVQNNLKLNVEIFSTSIDESLDIIIAESSDNLQITCTKGRIQLDDKLLEKDSGTTAEKLLVYLCGPTTFEENVLSQLIEAGMKEEEVKRESFKF